MTFTRVFNCFIRATSSVHYSRFYYRQVPVYSKSLKKCRGVYFVAQILLILSRARSNYSLGLVFGDDKKKRLKVDTQIKQTNINMTFLSIMVCQDNYTADNCTVHIRLPEFSSATFPKNYFTKVKVSQTFLKNGVHKNKNKITKY